jgi:hypothetical protein
MPAMAMASVKTSVKSAKSVQGPGGSGRGKPPSGFQHLDESSRARNRRALEALEGRAAMPVPESRGKKSGKIRKNRREQGLEPL